MTDERDDDVISSAKSAPATADQIAEFEHSKTNPFPLAFRPSSYGS